MRFNFSLFAGPVIASIVLLGLPIHLHAQPQPDGAVLAAVELPDAPQPQSSTPPQSQPDASSSAQPQKPDATSPSTQAQQPDASSSTQPRQPAQSAPVHTPPPQPKRILGMMPNYRAVSAGVIPPPPTAREAFGIATENSFDYSAFVFVGITSLLAEGDEAHPELGQGIRGFWRYSWRGFLDKTDGNYWVDWAMPTVLHEDERYFAKGEGGIWNRGIYSASRVLITPNYHGKNTFNTAEIVGRGASEAISLTYYPSQDQNVASFMQKYAYAVGRDALTNVFREFWPDVAAHFSHRHRH